MSNIKLISGGLPQAYTRMLFAGGEVHINVRDICEDNLTIVADFRNSDDIMEVLMLHDALKHNGCEHVELEITYMPYARQDRVCTPGDAFALEVFTSMINASEFYSVRVHDCHSEVGLNLLNNEVEWSQLDSLLHDGFEFKANSVIVAPDAGAVVKSQEIANAYGIPCVSASKVRDPKTGNLTGFKLHAEPEQIKDKHVYIFDDICDGGGTFLGLGNLIQELEPKQMHLHLTNGIFSNPNQHDALKDMFVLTAQFDWTK